VHLSANACCCRFHALHRLLTTHMSHRDQLAGWQHLSEGDHRVSGFMSTFELGLSRKERLLKPLWPRAEGKVLGQTGRLPNSAFRHRPSLQKSGISTYRDTSSLNTPRVFVPTPENSGLLEILLAASSTESFVLSVLPMAPDVHCSACEALGIASAALDGTERMPPRIERSNGGIPCVRAELSDQCSLEVIS
jgi:hypothetical protein